MRGWLRFGGASLFVLPAAGFTATYPAAALGLEGDPLTATLGLAPIIVDQIMDALKKVYIQGNLSMILVEQDVQIGLEFSQRAYVLETGRIVKSGMSGDLANAQKTFQWAITQEPEYPMFYYNLACTYAEMDNLDQTIRNLRLAFKYKSKNLPGDRFPDPKSDSSFKKYLNNREFTRELEKM
jgi:energy-coupling factor transporter ATP-binding protein EcfA2